MLTELDSLQKRLEALRLLIGRLRETTSAASITSGVLHHGQGRLGPCFSTTARSICGHTDGPTGCLWSTVPDMLKGSKLSYGALNPLEPQMPRVDMNTITAHHSQLTHRGLFENSYGHGWARLSMPSRLYAFFSTDGADEQSLCKTLNALPWRPGHGIGDHTLHLYRDGVSNNLPKYLTGIRRRCRLVGQGDHTKNTLAFLAT
ncbi:unnamed protein product [Clonostachys byssicola]|uniref:Uncharacterized protein n=1 Tax=Clonostachys byssicola TaxID=160290 RepID=A0A9N9UB75_9HYPO|nr:unnamed protein product [Clonostachys byssicola]